MHQKNRRAKISEPSHLGSFYHRHGDLEAAITHFKESEDFYFDDNTTIGADEKKIAADRRPFLHSEPGCRYVFLLIDCLHNKKRLKSSGLPSLSDIKHRIDFMGNWSKNEEKKYKDNRNYKQEEPAGFHQRPLTLI